jgi:hypothetical protein
MIMSAGRPPWRTTGVDWAGLLPVDPMQQHRHLRRQRYLGLPYLEEAFAEFYLQ